MIYDLTFLSTYDEQICDQICENVIKAIFHFFPLTVDNEENVYVNCRSPHQTQNSLKPKRH